MRYFVTGANGFIGSRICRSLLKQGAEVTGFCRPTSNIDSLKDVAINVVRGELGDVDSLRRPLEGHDFCIHLAGLAKPWSRNPDLFYTVNVGGTANVIRAVTESSCDKLVFTSTAGVFGSSANGTTLDEESPQPKTGLTDYVRSKQMAEQLVVEAASNGLNACIVNPTRTFGPGPLTKANSLTRIMAAYASGKWKLMPGNGSAIGNYVFVDDIVRGHILAAELGRPGKRYILGSENLSFKELFALIARHSGSSRRLWRVPKLAVLGMAWLMKLRADWTGIEPALTPKFAQKYFSDSPLSIERARNELGYQPQSIDSAIRTTMRWIGEQS